MAQFIKVGTTAELREPASARRVDVAGRSIAVFNLGGSYYAIDNVCPHRGGPLAEGTIVADAVICPWHGAKFDIKTGEVLSPPAREGVRCFPVRVNGGDVEIEVD
jgi:3-phenylpropionate/trans-cinnamate dioxygenase ferredoxin subunit